MNNSYVGQNVWKYSSNEDKKEIFSYCKEYIHFLNTVKYTFIYVSL